MCVWGGEVLKNKNIRLLFFFSSNDKIEARKGPRGGGGTFNPQTKPLGFLNLPIIFYQLSFTLSLFMIDPGERNLYRIILRHTD